MANEQPPWLTEIGRRAQVRATGRPVPPMPAGLRPAKQLDRAAAVSLEQDFRLLVEGSTPDQEAEINARILDAMSENRLSSAQAMRLLGALFRKNDGGPGLQRVMADGSTEDFNRWGVD